MRLKVGWVLIAVFLSAVSCSCSAPSAPVPYPPPFNIPPESRTPFETPDITLTDDETAKVIEIALSDSRVSEWLKNKSEYRVGEVDFFYVWGGSYASVKGTNPDSVPKRARIYPEVVISTGEEWIYQCQVFVNLQKERARMIDGPYPALHSPGRLSKLSNQKSNP